MISEKNLTLQFKKELKLLHSIKFIVTLGLQPEIYKAKEFTPKVVSVSPSVCYFFFRPFQKVSKNLLDFSTSDLGWVPLCVDQISETVCHLP